MKKSSHLHFNTLLPEEFKEKFYRQLHLHNLRRTYLFSWVIGIVFTLLLVVDYIRFQSREIYQGQLYVYLFLLHLSCIIYFAVILFIRTKREDINKGKINPKYIVYFTIFLYALSGPPQEILSFNDQGKVSLYLVLILLVNWALKLPHRFRLFFTVSSFILMTGTIITVGRQTIVEVIINLYEVIGFTIVALIFGTVDYNFRVKKFYSEQLLAREKKKIEELEKFKSSLYMNLTHEFRTPLTVIQGMTDLSKEFIREGAEQEFEEAFQTIHRSSSNLLRLVNQLLELAKLESQNMEIHLLQKDIVGFSKSLIKSLKPYAKKKNIELTFKSEFPIFYLDFDEEKMYSILSNLLSNALKFNYQDGMVALKISSSSEAEQEWLIIDVKDTGCGIDQHHLANIFDLFYRVSDASVNKSSGTGIGLALTRKLVELMNGQIKVESQLGEGSQFTVKIPITRNAPKSEEPFHLSPTIQQAAAADLIQPKKHDTETPLLLLVEDNEDLLNYMVSLLEGDYEIEVARDGLRGVEKAIELIPDIIISDVMMPEKDGFELCQELKQNEKTDHIPIILLTAKADVDDRLTGLESGADAYLTKPFSKKELFIRLQKLMDLRKKLQKKYGQLGLVNDQKVLKKENKFILRLNNIIESNLDNSELKVEDLAKGVFMSRMQLHRKLKALSNRSATGYLTAFRLNKAKKLLDDPSLRISEVAYNVGFQNPSYFSKVFQKEFGQTPSEFREA